MNERERAISVSEFLSVINELLGGAEAVVEGEVSQFNIAHGKWVFFTLKDQEEDAVVECFMTAFQLRIPIENGMLVQVKGRPGIHQRSGRFRISVREVTPVGEGALARALALLNAKLENEGFFSESRKRPLPYVPERIGLIASRESAAYSDFLKVLKARFGGLEIYVRHTQVEGPAAIGDILQAFSEVIAAKPEAIVLTRGGGSLESLAAFNSEPVVRAIFSSPIPVIVGVGHERDITLADLVADVRASTPSNAAELLVPDRQALRSQLDDSLRRIEASVQRLLVEEVLLVSRFERISVSFVRLIQERLDNFLNRIEMALRRVLGQSSEMLERIERLLRSFDPKQVLKRGYGIVYRDGQLVRSAKQVKTGDELDITLQDGDLSAKAL